MKQPEIINLEAKRSPKDPEEIAVSFDISTLPTHIVVGTYTLPFDTKVYVPRETASIGASLGHCICSKCGAIVDAPDRFCKGCGAKFTGLAKV